MGLKSSTVRRYVFAIIGGVVLVVIVALTAVYKGSPTVRSLKTQGWGGSYCGRTVLRLKGQVVLLNPNSSMCLLRDLNDSVTIEIFLGKHATAPERGQLVEVRGIAICKLFGYEIPEDRNRIVPSYIEESSHSVIH